MLGFIIITLIFIGAMVGFSKIVDIETVKKDWQKYRCRPDVMIMADYYGHNSTENMEFCLKNGFDKWAKAAIGPFYTYLGKFVQVLMTMLSGLNSIRMIFATIIGSATQVFTEFSGRIQALFYRFQMAAIRMKMLMGRVFATMYAVIFMGMSGIKATQNLGNTFLFKFLDTFCFDPDTRIVLFSGAEIPIKNVQIGDRLRGGQKVTAVFRFAADGQTMVKLPGNIIVSTNHYVQHDGKWILSKDHPDAQPHDDWNGKNERPLICLNTDTHTIPLGKYIFSDYDETEKGDSEAMKMATDILNGMKAGTPSTPISSEMACSSLTLLKTKAGSIPAIHVTLGTELNHGTVVGIVKKECTKICKINGDYFAAGTCLWSDNKWMRAYEISDVIECSPMVFYSFVVTPSAIIETASETVFRDYVEVHSKDLETPYATMLNKTFQQSEC